MKLGIGQHCGFLFILQSYFGAVLCQANVQPVAARNHVPNAPCQIRFCQHHNLYAWAIDTVTKLDMHYRAVIFDLDGTLLDTLKDIADSANRVLADRNMPMHPPAAYKQFIGEGVRQLFLRALPVAQRAESTVQECIEAYRGEYARNWNVKTRPYAAIPEMLDALVALGIKLAVLSNKPDEFTQTCVRELLPAWRFHAVLGATDALPRKPDPAGALEILGRLGTEAGSCLYLGDSGVDMKTAVAAGMFGVGALWGFRDSHELERDGAQALIEHPMQLLDLLA